ncbi:30S ribosomal protein S15 [candidate division TM6 bacterium RIFCSPHIGHO2_12_FULL_36_22]|nr:MAG: 30S ribosomal protein S15 [candidate division TM6 bacterium RIFCSPHIGHO2_12_FULL_36_22]
MTKELNTSIKDQVRQHPQDTGSSEVQIVDLTVKIKQLIEHTKLNKKDYSTKLGLLKMVSKRRKLLDYLKRTNQDSYTSLLGKIGLKQK